MAQSDKMLEILVDVQNNLSDYRCDTQKQFSEVNATLARNTKTLEEHVRRTEICERRLEVVETLHRDCPARKDVDVRRTARADIFGRLRDYSLIIGVLVIAYHDLIPLIIKWFSK